MFSCKFAAYFQNTFSLEHFWRAASDSYQMKQREAICYWVLTVKNDFAKEL